jgi:NADH:ubiquinone oxidoreductase subunit D
MTISSGYSPYAKYAIIEYRIAWGEDGDCHDLEIYEGKHWRRVRKIVKLCEQGLDEPIINEDGSKWTIQWIERVERWMDQHGNYTEDDDYEDLWSRSQSEKEES